MDFSLTDEQIALQDTLEKMMRSKAVRRWIDEARTNGTFPRQFMNDLGSIGILGMNTDEQYGGGGLDYLHLLTAVETIAYHSMAFALNLIVQATLAMFPIQIAGTEEQKKKYLPRMVTGGLLGCFANTEPDVGSDAKSIKLKAAPDGDGWILNGTKHFITNASEAGVAILSARTSKRKTGWPGITLFVFDMDPDIPEVKILQQKKKCQYGATLCEIVLQDFRVGRENILGELDQGWPNIEATFNHSRPAIAMQGVGGARRVRDELLNYLSGRPAFGKPLLDQDVIRADLADLHTQIEATRLMAYRATDEETKQDPAAGITASMAKLLAGRVACEAADMCVQYSGGQSALTDSIADKYEDDLHIIGVYEGPTPIQKKIIGNHLAGRVRSLRLPS